MVKHQVWGLVGSLKITYSRFTAECANERILNIRQYFDEDIKWWNFMAYFFYRPPDTFRYLSCVTCPTRVQSLLCLTQVITTIEEGRNFPVLRNAPCYSEYISLSVFLFYFVCKHYCDWNVSRCFWAHTVKNWHP